jgi:translocation-and-assembly-module (TAM) inner membrane subunit TamB-like protein
LLLLIGLILLAWLAIQTTPVQNWLVKKVTNRLSKSLNTEISVRHVDLDLFNTMNLKGTLIRDRNRDTLLYAGVLKLNITDWFFFKDQVELKYVGLQDASIQLKRTDSVWNYQFLVDYFGGSKNTDSTKKPIQLRLSKLELDNIHLLQQDSWRGEDQELSLISLDLDAELVNATKKQIIIRSIDIDQPYFTIYNYTGNRPDSLRPKRKLSERPIVNDPAHLRWNAGDWNIEINTLTIKDGAFKSDQKTDRKVYETFDGAHIFFSDITGKFNDVKFKQDSITFKANFRTNERSGLQVKQFVADVRFHPEAMEFNNLDIKTNDSRLTKSFALRYDSFDDLGKFITDVRMEGNFNNAEISSDDIAFFAPELKKWDRKILINGKITGTVENLQAKNLTLQAGNSTYLNGNIKMSGLPDIDKTYIDFTANSFRTTYFDAITLIPELKDIKQPRLDLLQWMRFKGNFTGFMRDFVAYGTTETNLGLVVTDLNMKLPEKGLTSYSGTVKTPGFQLGQFLEVSNIGTIAFEGNVNGSGLTASSVNAKLDGTIASLVVNDYDFKSIVVKGDVSKRLFNGELVINDPNLDVKMNGLVDFTKDIPEFDFDANVGKADLKKINFVKDNIEFNGKFHFDFSGNDLDNFLGSAKVYEASVLKDGIRIPFDSLSIESKVVDNNKAITILSNEFDAALVGEFSIKELPAAFQTFLNRYYPSYINPSKRQVANENFSFVITTKKVDEYLSFVDPNLKGFNYSTITGRINTKNNLLDLNAEVPQFSYKNITAFNTKFNATGSLDSLTMHGEIADIYIDDSLHFPGTALDVRSFNDISEINITTSANQTLNAANISAQVQTLRDGARILFRESNFDLNGKNWTIQKDGELVLSEKMVSADGVRIFNGQQEILVTTHPSDIGTTNDIKVELNKVNIGDFAPYVIHKNRLEGLLSGTIDVLDPFGKYQVDIKADADQFRLDDDSVGKLQLNANYSQRTGKVNFNATSENKDYNFDLQGIYNLLDSTSAKQLDITTNLTDTKINYLEHYLSGIFSDLTGYASGQLHIVGPVNRLKYLGKMSLKDASLRVNYTNVTYTIPSASIDLKDGYIDFGSFNLKDKFNNVGHLTRGRLYHQGFDDLAFDFEMNSPKLLALATDGTHNEQFFGTAIAKAAMRFSGPLENMVMDIRGEPADSSEIYIRNGGSKETGQADFIVWKVYGREMATPILSQESNLAVNLDITANRLVQMNVIIDEYTGDIIKAIGYGNLVMHASTDGEFTITGHYDIEKGNYNFNFESLLRKPFTLREGAGNYIRWKGDPYDAELKVTAEYEAEDVSFADLALPSYFGDDVRKFRGKVLVISDLTGNLMSPNIKFRLELPPGSPLQNNPEALLALKQIQDDQNELNKQVAFLIVFNSFGPLSTADQSTIGNIAIEGIVVSSISGALSNILSKQFSNIFQKVFNDKSIRVNFNAQLYSGKNFLATGANSFLIDRTALNLSIGKSLFNERLTFTFGSAFDFGLTSDQIAATKNFEFLPDLNAEWKIRPDGKLVLSIFYRNNYGYFAAGTGKQTRSGASISFRRDADKFGDLFRKEKKKKIKLKPNPDPKIGVTSVSGDQQ